MKPIDVDEPADTRTCLRYWPVTSAIPLDMSLETQFEAVAPIDMSLEAGFELLSLADASDPVYAGIQALVQEVFHSDDIQKIRLKEQPEPKIPSSCTANIDHEDAIYALALRHPAVNAKPTDDAYAELFSYIRKSVETGTQPLPPPNEIDGVQPAGESKRPCTKLQRIGGAEAKPGKGADEIAGPLLDIRASNSLLNIEALEEFMTEIFSEEDELADDSDGKPVLFQRILDIGVLPLVLCKHSVRRIRALLEPCAAAHLSKHVSSDRLNRLVGLLVAAIQTAKDASLASMIKDGMLVDRGTELVTAYCERLELAMSVTCLGLEVAVLVFHMVAQGKALHVSSMGDLLHDCLAFLKECLLDCVVPLLDMDAECELAHAVFNRSQPLHGQMCTLLEAALATTNSVTAITAQHALCEEDIVPLLYASISVMFCSSALLSSGVESNLFESVRRSSQSLLRSVFELRADQRPWILEEILASLIKLPAQKRVQSMHRIAGGKSVQFITVLLLQLLQATAQSPEDLTAGFESGALSAKEYRILLQRHKKAVSMVSSSADFTIRYMIGRCAKRESKGTANEAEFRALLELFINDCVVLLGHPQWPAAELVVRIYSLHILEVLDDDKSDVVLKALALESAAQIASHIAQSQRLHDSSGGDGSGLEWISPSSSLESISRFQTATTTILEYLQAKVVSGESTGAIPLYIGNWAAMLVATLLKGSRSESSSDNDADTGDSGADNSDLGSDDSDSDSDSDSDNDQKDVSSTFDIHKRKAIEECLQVYAAIAHRSTKAMSTTASYTSAAEAARATLLLQPLYRSFDMLLTRVTLALGASQVALRSKALRALNQIALHRPPVLYQANVKYAINHRLQDSSPQVREAAIDLIGKHIAHNPELTDQYYEFISVRVLDKGSSVRRRVMRILADIYALSENIEQLVDIGIRLLQRTNDDERTIRELAFKTLQELWFSYSRSADADEETVAAETARNVFNTLSPDGQKEMLKRVRVMTGVVEAVRSHELVDLMASLFEHVSSGPSQSEAEDAQLVIRCVIDALFEQLLRAEESAADGLDAGADIAEGFSVATCLRFISTLSSIAPEAVGLHAESLSAYLKLSKTAEQDTLANVLVIFGNTLLKIPHPGAAFLRSLEDDLISLLSSSPQNILALAVPCLCDLIEKLTRNHVKLIRVFRSCVLQLCREQRVISGGGKGALTSKNLMRFIILAGLSCRYFDFDKHRQRQKEHFRELDQLAKGSMVELLNELLLFFARPIHSAPVQLAAIQMLGQLHIKRPRLAVEPQARAMMDRALAGDSASHQLQVLRNFLEFLRTDAKRLAAQERDDRSKEREIDAKALVGNTGGMSEAGVGASLMQTYLDRIIGATFATNAAPLRAAGFEVISLVLEQGLAHPLKCMPALIALSTSSDPYIRNKALKLHQELSFKHASFIHSRDLEGVRKAYEYQLLVRGQTEDVSGYDSSADLRDRPDRPAACLQFLYSLSRSRRTRRNELLTMLVKACDFDAGTAAYSDANSTDIPFVRFVAENISALEFKYLDEVLHTIYQISSVIASSGLNLYQQIETDATHEASAGDNAQDAQWQQATRASVCISILFVLREFLKSHYGVSESRCTSYNPGEAAGARDKAAAWHAQDDGGRIDWGPCPYALQRMESTADCIAQRQRFRRMMAESLVASEESPVLAANAAADRFAPDAPGDELLNAEDLEMLSVDDLDEAG
ncbi:Sister chromatid cohesion protein 2 [Coemansia sp. RSA 2611]|nr:Sister chromatid cohesion protein 2 [Coemansia sp. RSA 2611]